MIKAGTDNHHETVTNMHLSLKGVAQVVDIVLATPETVERYKDSFALVDYPALREGQVVYQLTGIVQ